MQTHNSYDFPTLYQELQPYADMVVTTTRGRQITVGDMQYVTHQTLYSTAVYAPGAAAVTPFQVDLFKAGLNEQGQGWAGSLTKSETNFEGSNGQFAANQAFVATRAAWSVWKLNDHATNTDANQYQLFAQADDLLPIITKGVWDLSIGRGPTRIIGNLTDYPAGYGVHAVNGGIAVALGGATTGMQNGCPGVPMKPLDIPIVFPPLVSVDISAKWRSGFTLSGNPGYIAVKLALFGFQFTMPT